MSSLELEIGLGRLRERFRQSKCIYDYAPTVSNREFLNLGIAKLFNFHNVPTTYCRQTLDLYSF